MRWHSGRCLSFSYARPPPPPDSPSTTPTLSGWFPTWRSSYFAWSEKVVTPSLSPVSLTDTVSDTRLSMRWRFGLRSFWRILKLSGLLIREDSVTSSVLIVCDVDFSLTLILFFVLLGFDWDFWVLGFADWTWEEFRRHRLGAAQNCSATLKGNHKITDANLPEEVCQLQLLSILWKLSWYKFQLLYFIKLLSV